MRFIILQKKYIQRKNGYSNLVQLLPFLQGSFINGTDYSMFKMQFSANTANLRKIFN